MSSPSIPQTNPEGDRTHQESSYVAFTEVWLHGRRWNVTIRQGMDMAGINLLTSMLVEATLKLNNLEVEHRPMLPPEASENANLASVPDRGGNGAARPAERHSQPAGEAAEPRSSRPQSGVERITRLVVTGLLDAPTVQLWSGNEKLKFPFMTPPSQLVFDILSQSYTLNREDASIERLFSPGVSLNVTWDVAWEASPKNPKWKDLVEITIIRPAGKS